MGAHAVVLNGNICIVDATFILQTGNQSRFAIFSLRTGGGIASDAHTGVIQPAIIANCHTVGCRQAFAGRNIRGLIAHNANPRIVHLPVHLQGIGLTGSDVAAHRTPHHRRFTAFAGNVAGSVAVQQNRAAIHLAASVYRQGIGIDAATIGLHIGSRIAAHGNRCTVDFRALIAFHIYAIGSQNAVFAATTTQHLVG